MHVKPKARSPSRKRIWNKGQDGVDMKNPKASFDSGNPTGYVSKKCPECMEYMPLKAEVCPSCKLPIGKINRHGMASRKTDWKEQIKQAVHPENSQYDTEHADGNSPRKRTHQEVDSEHTTGERDEVCENHCCERTQSRERRNGE